MPRDSRKRTRMMFDLEPEVQMAIRLWALKNRVKMADVIKFAVSQVFAKELKEASALLAQSSDESARSLAPKGKRR